MSPDDLWGGGSEYFLLCLCMNLICSRTIDGLEPSQVPAYSAAKRFITIMETSGTMSLMVLQSNIIVTLYEYGHSIYPAAYISAAWSVRYAQLLGVDGHDSSQMLGQLVRRHDVIFNAC